MTDKKTKYRYFSDDFRFYKVKVNEKGEPIGEPKMVSFSEYVSGF
jgi:hypothetical protein